MAKLYDREEHIAGLQYEAGMYQSLYENAIAQRAALVKALEEIAAENDLDPSPACRIAREALNGVVACALQPASALSESGE